MPKKAQAISLLFLLLLITDGFAFQFQDYQWGQSVDGVMKKLQAEGIRFSYSGYGITYESDIFGDPCEVYLNFSPESKLLAFISIWWQEAAVGEKVKKNLSEKYGPTYPILPDTYFWLGPKKEIKDSIYLNYSSRGTRLIYFGEEYYEKYVEESRKLIEND